jgi:hypothetical protein
MKSSQIEQCSSEAGEKAFFLNVSKLMSSKVQVQIRCDLARCLYIFRGEGPKRTLTQY